MTERTPAEREWNKAPDGTACTFCGHNRGEHSQTWCNGWIQSGGASGMMMRCGCSGGWQGPGD